MEVSYVWYQHLLVIPVILKKTQKSTNPTKKTKLHSLKKKRKTQFSVASIWFRSPEILIILIFKLVIKSNIFALQNYTLQSIVVYSPKCFMFKNYETHAHSCRCLLIYA